MEIYIEYAILDNLIVDFFLLKESAVILRIKHRFWQVLLAAVIGTVVAVILPLFTLPGLIVFIIKLILAVIISYVAVSHRRAIDYVKYLNVFLLLTFLFGGIIIGVLSLIGIPYGAEAYYSNKILPIGLSVLIGYLAVKLIKKFVEQNISSVFIAKELYECELLINGSVFLATAFFDSGNRLVDEKSGLPIIVCKPSFIEKIKRKTNVTYGGKIYFTTAAGRAAQNLIKIDYVIVRQGKIGNVRHAMIIEGDINIKSADIIIGRALI